MQAEAEKEGINMLQLVNLLSALKSPFLDNFIFKAQPYPASSRGSFSNADSLLFLSFLLKLKVFDFDK